MEENKNHSVTLPCVDEPEKGYVLNKGMPRFVGRTEIRRLRRVIDEKNVLIEKFKSYDHERKEYYAAFMDDYREMKDSFDLFSQELLNVVEDGDISQSEHKKFLKLYKNWFIYKSKADLYKDKLAAARESVRDIKEDIRKLEELLGRLQLDSTGDIEVVITRMVTMLKYLDTLQSKMIVN
jgi:hypothetical protein